MRVGSRTLKVSNAEKQLRKDKRITELLIGTTVVGSLISGVTGLELMSDFNEKNTAEKVFDVPLGFLALTTAGIGLSIAKKHWDERKTIKSQLKSYEVDREIEEEFQRGMAEVRRSELAAWKMIQDEEDEGPPLK